MSQLDLFAQSRRPVPVSDTPDPAAVRRRMETILAELTEAERMPWTEQKLNVWRTVWPQMSRWLPDADRKVLIRRFDKEIERLADVG